MWEKEQILAAKTLVGCVLIVLRMKHLQGPTEKSTRES